MLLNLHQLRECVRANNTAWYRIAINGKGPCGAVAMAQILTGYGDTLHWCETKSRGDDRWYSHWLTRKAGVLADISGEYINPAVTTPLYRRMTRRFLVWPREYAEQEVLFWARAIKRAERSSNG